MARPAKSTNTIDIEKLIAEAVANAVSKVRAEYENSEDIQPENKNIEYVDIPDTLKIELVSNVVGKFFLKDREDSPSINTVLGDRGDTIRITYQELNSLKRNKPQILYRGMLAIKRVLTDNKAYTIEQVWDELGLSSLYSKNALATPNNFDRLFEIDVDANQFNQFINNNPDLFDTLLEIGYEKFRKGIFNDNAKMSVFRTLSKNENYFK